MTQLHFGIDLYSCRLHSIYTMTQGSNILCFCSFVSTCYYCCATLCNDHSFSATSGLDVNCLYVSEQIKDKTIPWPIISDCLALFLSISPSSCICAGFLLPSASCYPFLSNHPQRYSTWFIHTEYHSVACLFQ